MENWTISGRLCTLSPLIHVLDFKLWTEKIQDFSDVPFEETRDSNVATSNLSLCPQGRLVPSSTPRPRNWRGTENTTDRTHCVDHCEETTRHRGDVCKHWESLVVSQDAAFTLNWDDSERRDSNNIRVWLRNKKKQEETAVLHPSAASAS